MATRKPPKRRPRRSPPASRRSGAKTAGKRASSRGRSATRGGRAGAGKKRSGVKATARRSAKPAAKRPSAKAASSRRAAASRKTRKKTPRPGPRRQAPQAKAPTPSPSPRSTRSRAAAVARVPHPARPSTLERERRTLADEERLEGEAAGNDRMLAAARSGHDELVSELRKHTAATPKLTAGDLDANWEDAYAVGDEAPGGDNPTPDQDIVDDIGKAVGITYQDDEELRGGEEVAERDRHRWERDPASSDDWPEGHEK